LTGGIDFMNLEVAEWTWKIADLDFRVVYLLLILMLIDILTGLTKAWHKGNLWSRKGMFGFIRKIIMLLVIVAASVIDEILQMKGVIAGATLLFFCVSESISIIENAEAAGVPVPPILKDKLSAIHSNSDRSLSKDFSEEFTLKEEDQMTIKVDRKEKIKDGVEDHE